MGYLGTYRDVGLSKMDIIVILKSIANKALLFDQGLVTKNHQSIFSFSDDLPKFLTTYNPKSYFNDYCNERISEFEKKLRLRLMTKEELSKDEEVSFPRKELTRNDKYFKNKDNKIGSFVSKEQEARPAVEKTQPNTNLRDSESSDLKLQAFESRDQVSSYPPKKEKEGFKERDPRFSMKNPKLGGNERGERGKLQYKGRNRNDSFSKEVRKSPQKRVSSKSSSSSQSSSRSSNKGKERSRTVSSKRKDKRQSRPSTSSSRRSSSSIKSSMKLPRQRK